MVIQTLQNALKMHDRSANHHDMKNLMRATPNIESAWEQSLGKSSLLVALHSASAIHHSSFFSTSTSSTACHPQKPLNQLCSVTNWKQRKVKNGFHIPHKSPPPRYTIRHRPQTTTTPSADSLVRVRIAVWNGTEGRSRRERTV